MTAPDFPVTLTEANIRKVEAHVPGKPYFEPDGSWSGLSVFTPTGRVKAEFGDVIVRNSRGEFHVAKTTTAGEETA